MAIRCKSEFKLGLCKGEEDKKNGEVKKGDLSLVNMALPGMFPAVYRGMDVGQREPPRPRDVKKMQTSFSFSRPMKELLETMKTCVMHLPQPNDF